MVPLMRETQSRRAQEAGRQVLLDKEGVQEKQERQQQRERGDNKLTSTVEVALLTDDPGSAGDWGEYYKCLLPLSKVFSLPTQFCWYVKSWKLCQEQETRKLGWVKPSPRFCTGLDLDHPLR